MKATFPITFDEQVNRFGLWSAFVDVATLAISLFLPLGVCLADMGLNMPTGLRG
jgi:hypothetical protein